MTLHPVRAQRVLPPKPWESAEVGVGRHHGTAMLHSDCRVLGVSDQFAGGSGLTAQSFEYVQVIRARTHNARCRAFCQRGYKRERLIESRRRVEDSGVGHDSDEAGQNEDGESERFRPCRQTGDPTRILGMIGGRVLDVRVYQDIYVRKQHIESSTSTLEQGLVILCVERPRLVEIDSGAEVNTAHGYQPEWRRLRHLATLQSVVQRPGNEGTYADAAGFGCATHLLRKLVVKRDRSSHDA